MTAMPADENDPVLPRLATGLRGFDEISQGGLPTASSTLVTGTVGSGKTVFALQFLAEGIRQADQPGVFVTFGESADKMRRFVVEFGWDVPAWEAEGRWAFVDATPGVEDSPLIVGEHYDLTVLLHRIANAVRRTGAKRVAIDSIGVLLSRFGDLEAVRDVIIRTTVELDRLGVTTVITLSREDESEPMQVGIEELVADNVIVLRNSSVEESRRRTLEVLKLRGTRHRQGRFPFVISREHGLVVLPLSVRLDQPAMSHRISSGIDGFEAMTGGGLFQSSVTLVSGSTGTGKTTFVLQFALAGATAGEPVVVVGFEESREQLLRGIAGWGYDIPALEASGMLRFVIDYPEVRTFEEHLVRIQAAAADIGARRVVLDSMTSLRRSGPTRNFDEFAIGLTAYLKDQEMTGIMTTGQASLVGPEVRATQEHVSALSDAIVLLRYVEVYGEVRRVVAVLKQRGSSHDKAIREYTITSDGVHIGAPLRTTTGLMSGRTTQLDSIESARVGEMFPDEGDD